MANYQTPLFSDDCPAPGTTSTPRPSRRGRHDPQFFNAQVPGSNAYLSLPEFVTGLWEGVYMVSTFKDPNSIRTLRLILEFDQASCSSKEVPLPDTQDFICKMPLQCLLDLYFYFGSEDSVIPGCIADEVSQWSATPKDFSTVTVSGCQCRFFKLQLKISNPGLSRGIWTAYILRKICIYCQLEGSSTESRLVSGIGLSCHWAGQ